MKRVAQAFNAGCSAGLPDEVSIDFRRLGFIVPAGVTYLSNLVLWLEAQNVTVSFTGHDTAREAIRFLDDSQFFARHLGSSLRAQARARDTTRPLVDVHHRDSQVWVRHELTPWLAARLNVSRASLYNLQVCVLEMFNNIQDHSTLEIGSIFAQHFPNMNGVGIAIADLGCGIPEVVRTVEPYLSDNDAIRKAVERGFTTGSDTHRNRGEGLALLLDTAVVGNGGRVTIYSLEGAIEFINVNGAVRGNALTHGGFCPGTTIDIWLRTDTIEDVPEETEEFTW